MKIDSLRPRRPRLLLLGAVLAAVLVAAGGSSAASPIVSIVMTSSPTEVTVATAGNTTYIGYPVTVTNNSSNTITHASLTDPAKPDPATGSPVFTPIPGLVFVGSTCANATTLFDGNSVASGVRCDLGNIASLDSVTVTLVYSIGPPIVAGSTVRNQSAVTVNEGPSDNQPGSAHTDTFFSTTDGTTVGPATTSVVNGSSSKISSYTLPATTTDIQSDPILSKLNLQSTGVHVPGSGAPNGVGVTLREVSPLNNPTVYNGVCPPGVKCFGEVSFISVSGSGLTSPFVTNPLTFTVSLYKDEIPGGVGPKSLRVYHDGNLVPYCNALGTSVDPSGDCVVSVVRNSGGTIIYVVQGPSNGGWGNA